MSPSSRKKIVRKVFYATGEAMAEVDKIKGSLMNIARSFQEGYQLLGHEPANINKEEPIKKCDQQLDHIYGYFGKMISDNIADHKLGYQFNAGFEDLQIRVGEMLEDINPKVTKLPVEENPAEKKIPNIDIQTAPAKEIILDEEIRPFKSDDPLERLKEVVQLSKLNTIPARNNLLSYLKDPDNLIRRVIVNCISPEGGEEETFAIVKLINDPDEDVARIAIRKSAKTRNRLAFSYLISKLESDNVKLRQEAINALVEITGSDLGFDPGGSVKSRQESVSRWNRVWQNNQMNAHFLSEDELTRRIVKGHHDQKKITQPAEDQGPVVKKEVTPQKELQLAAPAIVEKKSKKGNKKEL